MPKGLRGRVHHQSGAWQDATPLLVTAPRRCTGQPPQSSALNASHASEWKHAFLDAVAVHIGSIRVKFINVEPLELALKAISSPFPGRGCRFGIACLSPTPPLTQFATCQPGGQSFSHALFVWPRTTDARSWVAEAVGVLVNLPWEICATTSEGLLIDDFQPPKQSQKETFRHVQPMSKPNATKLLTIGLATAISGSALTVGALVATRRLDMRSPTKNPERQSVEKPGAASEKRAIAALGRLEPAGEIRVLAAPIAGISLPRVTQLFVAEGDRVQKGQLLATFDTGPVLRAQRKVLLTNIITLARRLKLESRELHRYRNLSKAGAFAADELDRREQQYLQLEGEWQVAKAELAKVEADLDNTELRAPITGTVLRIIARVGERPGDKGILEMGRNEQMEAVLEVYESDINHVRLGQNVQMTSENGGFDGVLKGRVIRISPQVRQREVLSTDPSTDVDARIVEVRVGLAPEDASRVKDLTGLKLIGRLEA